MTTTQASIVKGADATDREAGRPARRAARTAAGYLGICCRRLERARRVHRRARRGAHGAASRRRRARAGREGLELGCGPGGLGLEAARRLGPRSEVVVSDVAPEMTAIAARRVAELEMQNVSARDLDLEAIDEPDGSFDAVLCREGLMLGRGPGPGSSRDPACAAPGRTRGGGGLGRARAQPLAWRRLRHGQRPARCASPAARRAPAVLARRAGKPRGGHERCRIRGRSRRGGRSAVPGSLVRGLVGAGPRRSPARFATCWRRCRKRRWTS